MEAKMSWGYVPMIVQDEVQGQYRGTLVGVGVSGGGVTEKCERQSYLPRDRASRTSSEVESNLEPFDTICS